MSDAPAYNNGLPPTIRSLANAIRSRATSAEAEVHACLDRIATLNPRLNAFITVMGDTALEAARVADRELTSGRDRGPLHGVPVSLKDLIDVRGVPTTAASHVRKAHVATRDATVVARLTDAGAVIVGKTNLHEFALGTTNEDSAYGPARHPLDPERSPGGSSGGSAISVATQMAYASVGTDTGGSIRIPSAACGIVGLKPALGEVPTDGVVPLSTTLDHVGPMTADVADARLLYEVMIGRLPGQAQEVAVKGLRLGIPREYFMALIDGEIGRVFAAACDRLREAGAIVEDVTVEHAAALPAIYTRIALFEAAAYHASTLDERPGDYTPNVRARLEMGRGIRADDYAQAMHGREELRGDVNAALQGRDALLLPTMPVPATRLGAATVRIGDVEEPVRNVTLRMTQLFNVTGHPAISIPCGWTSEGLPVGAQLAGRQTDRLLDVAAALEPYLGPGRSR